MKKKTMTLLSVLLAATALTACGNDEKAASPGGSQASGGDEKVKLTFLSLYNEDGMKPLLDAFNAKYPNIEIDLQFAPPTKDYEEKLKVLTVTNEVPDLFFLNPQNRFEMIKNGYATDISDNSAFANLNQNNIDQYSFEGKQYAFAPDTWLGGILYNKKLFADAGIAGTPTTWAELVDTMNRIKAQGVKPIMERGEYLWTLPNALFYNDVISKDDTLDDQIIEGKKTFADLWTGPYQTWYKDIVQSGLYEKDFLGVGTDQFINEFATGQVAMIVGNNDHLKRILEANPDLDLGIFPLVGTEPGIQYLYGTVNVGIAVGSQTKNRDAAYKFIEFVGSPEGATLYSNMTGYLSGVNGSQSKVPEVMAEFNRMYLDNEVRLYLPHNNFGDYSVSLLAELVKASQDALAGVIPPEEVPQRLDAKLKELQQR
ncbi:ABC transporter substrate-binding protein [Cohnella cellulosilytica]|uniref:ABC transporter substrate-binding protein n=1 Tax=Cohnella cellulosilytica TaxID=986710 RepID=A0ABW2F8N6_9BACL